MLAVVLGLSLTKLLPKKPSESTETSKEAVSTPSSSPVEEEPQEPQKPPIIDMSGNAIDLETDMIQINEPTAYDGKLLYSAGDAPNIDGPVLTKLMLYDMNTKEEKTVAETQLKFGEIYEGRFNEDWIIWLDTNQSGTNNIHFLDRHTGEISQVKRCDLNKPQLVLWGDNLVWVEQKDEEQDRLYLYNFKSGEPISLESFDNSTYGTCPPSVCNDILVWVYPHPQDAGRSIIKKLNLKEALVVDEMEGQQSETSEGQETVDEGLAPETIDPKGFAIYPHTNGNVIAWLDDLDPNKARLMMTKDDGKAITVVAESVGRLFGVGDNFIVYTQGNTIMLYFWEIDRYARLTAPGEKGMLSKSCVSGNIAVWYDASDPSRAKDGVKVNIIEQPSVQ